MRAALLCLLLSGCALLPNEVRPELEHMSHASQHFGSDPTNYGANMVNLVLAWTPGPVRVELAEGYDFSPHWPYTASFGEIIGPREEFSGRISYVFEVPRWQ